jgi:hypothetical protein
VWPLWLIIGGLLTWHGVKCVLAQYQFVTAAQTSIAEIVQVHAKTMESKRPLPIYFYTFRFPGPSGQPLTVESSEVFLESIEQEKQVEVLYNPAVRPDPSINKFSALWQDPLSFLGAGLLICLLTLISGRKLWPAFAPSPSGA